MTKHNVRMHSADGDECWICCYQALIVEKEKTRFRLSLPATPNLDKRGPRTDVLINQDPVEARLHGLHEHCSELTTDSIRLDRIQVD